MITTEKLQGHRIANKINSGKLSSFELDNIMGNIYGELDQQELDYSEPEEEDAFGDDNCEVIK